MNKLPSKLSLLTLLIFTNLVPNSALAEARSQTKTPKESTSILQALLSLFKAPEKRFISRGEAICPISPGNSESQLIWSVRPLFIWQGETMASEIELFSSASNDEGEQERKLMWQETVTPNTQTLAYAGEELQPGFTYDWDFIAADGQTHSQKIVLIEQQQRDAIAADLNALSTELKNNGANEEEIAIAKADYFVQQKLGSDALQQLYSVANPSPNLTRQIDEIEQYLCQQN